MSRVASIDMKDSKDRDDCRPDYINSENSIIFMGEKDKQENDCESKPDSIKDEPGFIGLQIIHEDFTTFRDQTETESVAREISSVNQTTTMQTQEDICGNNHNENQS